MVWVVFFEVAIPLLLLMLFITQMLVPVFRGTPMFPLLRSRPASLEKQLTKAREEVDNAKLRRRIVAAEEVCDDLDIETSHLEGDGGKITDAEYQRLCRESNEKKRTQRDREIETS